MGAPGAQDGNGNGSVSKDGQPMGEAKGTPGLCVIRDGWTDIPAEALSHVPCRFYRAGTCTAGSSCPFSHEEGGTKEICQWFLKGNCKFGHKCSSAAGFNVAIGLMCRCPASYSPRRPFVDGQEEQKVGPA